MRRGPLPFLPVFFTVLGTVLVAAIVWRAVSYSSRHRSERAAVAYPATGLQPNATAPPAVLTDTVPLSTTPQPSTQAPDAGSSSAQRPRAEAAPPQKQGPAPVASQNPSLLSRIVSPIVTALGGNGARPAGPQPPASRNAQTASQASQTQSSSSSRGSDSTHTGDKTSTAAEKDPSSDSQPPQLVNISFNPPQINDGEVTQLVVQATDDLSGVRTISGTVVGPSGAAQGFACQKEGDPDRYVARVAVPKDAAEGVWRVNYLSLIDMASNAATISGAQVPPSATFRVVSSGSDSQGPSLRAIWLDRPAMRAGEKNTVFVDAQDDKSGLGLVSGVFVSPARHARIGFVCRPGDGPWQCEFAPPECIDCGDWHLEQIQLQDKASNMTTVRSDNAIVSRVILNITGDRCDSTPPALQSVAFDRNAVSNVEESVINVTAFSSDDVCGTMSISGQVTGPAAGGAAPRLYFSFTPGGGDAWTGRIVVPRLAAKGTWRVTWIQVLDQAHNLRTYSAGDGVLANAAFNVQ